MDACFGTKAGTTQKSGIINEIMMEGGRGC
jgi:hypothetical protein